VLRSRATLNPVVSGPEMHYLVPVAFALFVALRWWEIRRLRSRARGDIASRFVQGALPAARTRPLRRAVLEEATAWVVAALGVLVLIGIAYALLLVFGPIRPIHEWGS
jgi:hypothetical protein